MKRIVATLLAFLFATAAHAQSGLLPANQVWAGPPSGGQGFARARALVAADLPTLAPGGLSLASGQIMVGQVSGFAGAVAMSGDCTIVASGAITCTKTGGVALAALATTAPGAGVATALGTAVGSAGAVVVNGGALGTPSSGTLTNATGLPISTGVSGLGTGVATARGVAVGSAGAPVVNGGALGTPSSGVGTNLTALNASNFGSGTLAVARGGTGDTGTAGTTYTPTLGCGTGTLTTAAATGRFKTLGKTVFVEMAITITTNGTCATFITATLPPATAAVADYFLGGKARAVSGKLVGAAVQATGTTIAVANYDNTYPGANGEIIDVSGVFEAQ